MNQLIVTTSAAGSSRTQLWNPERPLPLGHPMKWIAERTPNGVRIRHLASRPGEIVTQGVCEIPDARIIQSPGGAEVTLPNTPGVSIRIRQARPAEPAFGGRAGDKLSVFACNGRWVMASALFTGSYTGLAGKERVFTLRDKSGGAYGLEIHVEGALLQNAADGAEQSRQLKKGESLDLAAAALADTSIALGTRSWRFGLSKTVALAENVQVEIDHETAWFRKALRAAFVGLGVIALIALLWPKPSPDVKELIPAQYAKIVMAKPKPQQQAKPAAGSESAPAAAASAPEKVQKAAVVQAFRAKALSSAVSGLLKGGMTSLLAQSDFVAGAKNTADARKIFDQRSSALAANGPTTGLDAKTDVKVANIGGTGGKGVGYGKGERAAVKGQGSGFVSMDVAGATVDEGLTKDEVGEVIHRHISEVRYCYESAMVRTPDLEGKLMTGFTIGPNGMVKSTEIKSSTIPDPRLDDCIIRRLMTWKFPNPRGGVEVTVAYPFIFKTLGR